MHHSKTSASKMKTNGQSNTGIKMVYPSATTSGTRRKNIMCLSRCAPPKYVHPKIICVSSDKVCLFPMSAHGSTLWHLGLLRYHLNMTFCQHNNYPHIIIFGIKQTFGQLELSRYFFYKSKSNQYIFSSFGWPLPWTSTPYR